MTTDQLNAVVAWLEKSQATYSSERNTSNFVRQPITSDKVQAAQDTYHLLLSEARQQRDLSITYGGFLHFNSPTILITNNTPC